jgi:phospholipid/cholesterol/gamma-HCH transport system substrate-binding protein
MGRGIIETVLGAVVLLVAVMFVISAYNSSDLRPVSGYQIGARFNSVDGLTSGNDVRIGGVKVGTVTDMAIDPKDYQVVVHMTIAADIALPDDSSVSVTGDGLLGGKYVRIEPGNSEQALPVGGELRKTKDVVVLEQLLGRIIFMLTEQ